MEPDQSVLDFVKNFAQQIIHRDFVPAHHFLAPWLKETISPDTLQTEIDLEIQATLEACGEREECQPQAFEIDWNSSLLASLRADRSFAPNRSIDEQITNDNFKHWICIQFQPTQDQPWELDAFFDLWLIIVALDTGLAIGYYEILEPD